MNILLFRYRRDNLPVLNKCGGGIMGIAPDTKDVQSYSPAFIGFTPTTPTGQSRVL